jgi:hypothetical protein
MNKNERNISVTEAKLALEHLAKATRDSDEAMKAPLWLIGLLACLYGFMTFSLSSARHENLWTLGFIISTIAFLLVVVFYLYTRRLLGVKPRLLPKSKAEFIFHLSLGITFGAIFALTMIFSKDGIWWIPHIGAIINTLLLAYIMHNAPSGHYFSRKDQNE